jgi:hypothetical protein
MKSELIGTALPFRLDNPESKKQHKHKNNHASKSQTEYVGMHFWSFLCLGIHQRKGGKKEKRDECFGVKKVHRRHGHQQVESVPARTAGRSSCLGGEPGSVGVRCFLVGVGEPLPQSATRAFRPVLELSAVPVIRIVIGVLSLVTAESTAELLLTLRALVHKATCALGTAEATGALRSHAEATESGLHTGRGLAVPGTRVRLVAELAKRSGC